MPPIATYVFFDFGSMGLLDVNPTITELHMSAVSCEELRRYFKDGGEESFAELPDVTELHCKLDDDVMWFLGNKYRDPEECRLKDEIVTFLNDLEKPLCLIAYNGPKFDFPLLSSKLADVEGLSTKGILCADAMAAFYDILEPDSDKTSYAERRSGSFPWPYKEGRKNYRLSDVCRRVLRYEPNMKNAEVRNKLMMHIALGMSFEFMLWVAENKCSFTRDIWDLLPCKREEEDEEEGPSPKKIIKLKKIR